MANSPGYKALLIRSDSRKKIDVAKKRLEKELEVELNYSQFVEMACNKVMGSPIMNFAAPDVKPGSLDRYIAFGLEVLGSKKYQAKQGEVLKLKRVIETSLMELSLEHRIVIRLSFGLSRIMAPVSMDNVEALTGIRDVDSVVISALADFRKKADRQRLLTFFESTGE